MIEPLYKGEVERMTVITVEELPYSAYQGKHNYERTVTERVKVMAECRISEEQWNALGTVEDV